MHGIFSSQNAYRSYDHKDKVGRGFEFTIDYNGQWYVHSGAEPGPIRRKKLMRLFGGAGSGFMAGKGLMVLNDGHYVVKSPDGAYGVDVEDVPFLIVDWSVNDTVLTLITNLDEALTFGANDVLYLRPEPLNNIDVLYCEVRDGLMARFSKSVFEAMASYFVEHEGRYSLDFNGFQVRVEQ